MARGPRESAHREHKYAVAARKAALKGYGPKSEQLKAVDTRLAEAVKNLPEPPKQWD